MKDLNEKYIDVLKWNGKLYDYINQKFFENTLSKPVLTVLPDIRGNVLGWFFRCDKWKDVDSGKCAPELNICAEHLNRPAIELAETMLHEMCHQFAYANNIQDCSRSGTYHNKKFLQIAEAHGLNVVKTQKGGFNQTSLTEESKKIMQEFVSDEKFIYRLPDTVGTRVKSNVRKYFCPICGASVRATKLVNIRCDDCDELMREEE